MAGLLDIFGTGGSDTMSLLGVSPADIQRNRDDAQAQALYALAGRLFQGGNTGASIAQGLQQGQQAYKTAMQGSLQDQLQAYQLQELKKKKELEQQALMRQQGVENLITQAYRPQTFAETPLTNIMGQEIAGPNQPQAAGLGLAELAPKLMSTKEGRSALNELLTAQKSMAGETFKLGEGEKQYQRDTLTGEVKEVATGAPKRVPLQSDIEKYEFAKKNDNYKGSFTQFLLDEAKAKATNINMPSEGERKAATLASRLNFSVGQMNQAIGADPKAAMPNTTAEIARFVSRTEFLPNKLTSEQRQVVEAAQEDILDAALTLGTGAAYSREQLAGYKKSYFPQLGDSPTTVKTKQDRLDNLLKSAAVASGRAAKEITAPIPAQITPKPIETSPFNFSPAKEDRYQQWLKKQQGG